MLFRSKIQILSSHKTVASEVNVVFRHYFGNVSDRLFTNMRGIMIFDFVLYRFDLNEPSFYLKIDVDHIEQILSDKLYIFPPNINICDSSMCKFMNFSKELPVTYNLTKDIPINLAFNTYDEGLRPFKNLGKRKYTFMSSSSWVNFIKFQDSINFQYILAEATADDSPFNETILFQKFNLLLLPEGTYLGFIFDYYQYVNIQNDNYWDLCTLPMPIYINFYNIINSIEIYDENMQPFLENVT